MVVGPSGTKSMFPVLRSTRISVPTRDSCVSCNWPSTKSSKVAGGPVSGPTWSRVSWTSSSRLVASVVSSSRAPEGMVSMSERARSLCCSRAHAGIRCKTIPPPVGSRSRIPATRTAPPMMSTGLSSLIWEAPCGWLFGSSRCYPSVWRSGRDSNPRTFRSPVFKTGAFVRSATAPLDIVGGSSGGRIPVGERAWRAV